MGGRRRGRMRGRDRRRLDRYPMGTATLMDPQTTVHDLPPAVLLEDPIEPELMYRMSVAETVLGAMWRAAADRGDEQQAAVIEHALEAAGQPAQVAASTSGAAVWYANRGLRVFPLQPGSKQPLRGSHGVKDATTEVGPAWMWDDYNLAVACGDPFDVLDIDGDTGAGSFLDAAGNCSAIQVRAVCQTPRGLHIWVPAVDGAKNSKNEQTGFDYRTTGGYVVVPPSQVDGTVYRWLLPPIIH